MTNKRISLWSVFSSLVVLACCASPLVLLLVSGTKGNNLLWIGLLAFYFWPGCALIIIKAIKSRQLPVITGGPRINLSAGRHHEIKR